MHARHVVQSQISSSETTSPIRFGHVGHLGQRRLIGRGQLVALHAGFVEARSGRAGEQASLAVHVRAHLDDQLARFERLAGVEGWAEIETSPTAHARVEVDELLPVEVVEFGDAKVLLLFDVGDQRQRLARVGSAQEDVGRAGEHVRQLRDRDIDQQRGIGEHVRPPGDRVRAGQNGRIDARQGQGDRVGDPVDRRGVVVRRGQA